MNENQKENKRVSLANKRNMLLKKQKGLMKTHHTLTNFKEPVLILLRRNQRAEFYENATAGEFEFNHSDGALRSIFLNIKYLQTFDYGKNTFKGYICHEDNPLPLPNEPEVTTETVGIAIDKTLNDIKKWKAEEWKQKGGFYWKIFAGIAIIILAYAMYKMLVPSAPVEQVIVQQAPNIPTVFN